MNLLGWEASNLVTSRIMKPCSDVADDPTWNVKALLDRWAGNGSFQEYDLQIKLWCAFEAQGFIAIRLWIEPYERSQGFWRFSVQCATRTSCIAVESAVKAPCKSAGHLVEKDFVAAVVSGRRARGGFLLTEPGAG